MIVVIYKKTIMFLIRFLKLNQIFYLVNSFESETFNIL